MPKKVKLESFKYRFLMAAQEEDLLSASVEQPPWDDFVQAIELIYKKGTVSISWGFANPGNLTIPLNEPHFFLRGDNEQYVARQQESGLLDSEDPIKLKNDRYFKEVVMQVAQLAGYEGSSKDQSKDNRRLKNEQIFHDAWANSEDVENIDVRSANEVCTAPEMRYITQRLGDLQGKRLLDVGCGLGEASIYFALLGADVTSSDLSQGMLDATCRLARANGVSVTPHISAAEDMRLPQDAQFDIIYAGNLLHHVDIDQTLARIKPHLAPKGKLVTWDPLAYNPVINVYRMMATDVRTTDEHPLKWHDLNIFRKHFDVVETRYFWLTTLIIFLIMALVQRRNPNKERFWKVVVQEGNKWRWLYSPLEKIDKLLLMLVPPLRLLCWNVVVVATISKIERPDKN